MVTVVGIIPPTFNSTANEFVVDWEFAWVLFLPTGTDDQRTKYSPTTTNALK